MDQKPKKQSNEEWNKKIMHGAWQLLQLCIAAILLYYIVNFLDSLIK